jgi:hypothetical protein
MCNLIKYSTNSVKFCIKTSNGPFEMEAHVVPNDHLPKMIMVNIKKEDAEELDSNPLTNEYQIGSPDVLIGSKYHNELDIEKTRRLPSGFWLSSSILGPMLDSEGELAFVNGCTQKLPLVNSTITQEQEAIFEQLKQFCQQDSLYLDEHKTAEAVDQEVHENFRKSLKFDENEGRYEIELPFNEELAKLPINYALAKGRLNSTLAQQFRDGIIEEAPREADGPKHYLPHQFVWNEAKQKLRIVYDASSHLGKSHCLNDTLHAGPIILKDLAGCLIRFRQPKIVITADIQAAFLQLTVAKNHRDVTRFLWPSNPEDPDSPIKVFRFVRLTFGLNCSPFILGATLLEHLAKFPENPVAKLIQQNLYVDNIIMGVNNWEDTDPICMDFPIGRIQPEGIRKQPHSRHEAIGRG